MELELTSTCLHQVEPVQQMNIAVSLKRLHQETAAVTPILCGLKIVHKSNKYSGFGTI